MAKRGILIGVIAALLIAGRLALPGLLKSSINRSLDRIPGYSGRIESLQLHLWRGALSAGGLKLLDQERRQLLEIERIELSVRGRKLLKGELRAVVRLVSPRLDLVAPGVVVPVPIVPERTPVEMAISVSAFEIDSLVITDGRVGYSDPAAGLDLFISDLELTATGVSNRRRLAPVATLELVGRPMGRGRLELHAKFDTLALKPHLDMEATLREFPLVSIAGLLREHAGLVVVSGTLDLYTEVAVKEGVFKGYLKPFLKELAFAPKDTKGLKMRERVMGEVAQYTADVLENHRKGSAASRIAFSGSLEDPKVDAKAVLEAAFRHAFIRALKPGIEDSVETELVKKGN